MIIGLTGGIASGKTSIAKLFQDLGATIVDLDSLGHYLLKTDKLIHEKLVYGFGCGILNDRGEINRPKLGRLVFDNPDYLIFLNNIIHPRVIQLSDEIIQQELAKDNSKIIVMDVPLLIECNMTDSVDLVILVYADEETQIQRLMSRGLSEGDAVKRISSQMPFKEKQLFADYIIDNNDSFDDAIKQVKEIWNLIEKKA